MLDAIADRNRLCPMLRAACCIEQMDNGKGQLTVRGDLEHIVIQAPASLLREIFQRCDGSHTFAEILANVDNPVLRDDLSDLMQCLLDEQALIDASLACATVLSNAFQASPTGLVAHRSITAQISRRFLRGAEVAGEASPAGHHGHRAGMARTPLGKLFERRVSTYTFGENPPSVSALHQLLWSLAGVVHTTHPRVPGEFPHRTLASAGAMHLLEVYVALAVKVGGHAPGVYRVDYPDANAVNLVRVSEEHGLIPRTFSRPWELASATGAIFLAADPVVGALRYRNRSLQYLFMEAGAALQNGGLSADELGLGFATIGGFYEHTAARMCRLDRQLVLASAIFGSKPEPGQLVMAKTVPEIDFAWLNGAASTYQLPFFMARAQIKSVNSDRPYTWGRDRDPWMAMRKALAEAIEREGFRQPRAIVIGRIEEFANAIHPNHFLEYSKEQYGVGFPYQAFDPAHPYAWTEGVDVVNGQAVQILAELVFSSSGLTRAGFTLSRPFTQVTSSGCAASVTPADATLRAMLELIERDAFLRHWLEQSPGLGVPLPLLSDELCQRVGVLQATGCKVTIQQLCSQWAHVALVSAQHEVMHFTTIGMAASTELAFAIHSALEELEARVYSWLHGHAPSITLPEQVRTPEHHFELYGLAEYFRRADALLFPLQCETLAALPERIAVDTGQKLAARFASQGIHPLAVDITPSLHHIDQGRTALHVVKALIPGLLPIYFGFQREPLGMVPRIHPGSKFPHPFP
ncbi:MAG: YcaO-like family protein [Janthinobacterium lividum]